jgi:hypothetical protein
MSRYQRKQLPDGDVGEPAPLPRELSGLPDDVLADLSAHLDPAACDELGFTGQGFFPVAEPEPEPPPPSRWVHKAIFKRRFTKDERMAIRVARAGSPILEDFMDVLDSTDSVFLDDPDLIDGLGFLVSLNLLTAERAAAIGA